MKIYFECFFTHVLATLDLSQDRWNCAEQLATAYCDQKQKRKTQRLIENFARGSDLYHTVRNLIEDIHTDDFNDVLTVYKALHPRMHPDWQSALNCGLLVKAKSTIGNLYQGELKYPNNFTAILLQASDMNNVKAIATEILEDETIQAAELPEIIDTVDPQHALIPY